MFSRYHHNAPERRSSAALPISVLLLLICAIFVYLAIGVLLDEETQTVVYTPQITDTNSPRQ
ncbi:hypothetical protein [Ensifer sp. LC163]|uniref:hypothetical protein n=1 Tax=Ensifer sp. LC163 TaxID=1120652 RepID=UPI0008133081|nr:hypothetical protein [Ensifer sp. LC163]OCP34926.1 hypothetical protein BC360_29480 [Ensifer sp. LC163]